MIGTRTGYVLIVTALIALAGLSCDEPTAPIAPLEKLRVIGTVFPAADVMRELGGRDVSVTWLVEAGQRIEDLDPTPELRARLRAADYVISGGATERWAFEGFDDPYRAEGVLRLDLLPASRAGGGNGYVWLDPRVMKEAAAEFSRRLSAKRPEKQGEFTRLRTAYIDRLDALTTSLIEPTHPLVGRRVMLLSGNLSPLLRYLEMSWMIPVVNDPKEHASRQVAACAMNLQDADFAAIRDTGKLESIDWLIVEADTPPAILQELVERTGLGVITVDSFGSSGSDGRNSYLRLLEYDVRQLCEIGKALPSSKPAQTGGK